MSMHHHPWHQCADVLGECEFIWMHMMLRVDYVYCESLFQYETHSA